MGLEILHHRANGEFVEVFTSTTGNVAQSSDGDMSVRRRRRLSGAAV